jgi:hypothetical protein
MAAPNIVCPPTWVQSCSKLRPSARRGLLRRRFPRRWRQTLGRFADVGFQPAEHQVIWLRPGRSELSYIATGTLATSGVSGSSPRSSRNCRNTPAHNAITTSLTIMPKRFLIVLMSRRSSWV